MRLAALTLLMLALSVTAAFAQADADAGGTPAPLPSEQPVKPPADPNAPLVVGRDSGDSTAPVQDVTGQPKCECCGHYLAQSPTRVEAVVIRGGGEKELVNYESIPCMLRDTSKEGSKLVKFRVIDYTTAGTEQEVMLDGILAFYVYGARAIPGSSPPYIAAFSSEESARSAVDWLEGSAALAYGPLLKRWQADLAAAAATGDSDLPIDFVIPPGEDYFVCPCAAGDCDDVKSDTEGVCPKCGLALARRSEKLRLIRERAAAAKEAGEDAGK